MRYQKTLAKSVSCSGIGLHSGEPATLAIHPAPPDSGLVFVLQRGSSSIPVSASIEHLVPSELCTALSANGCQIQTVEHVLAALVGLEVDNAYIEIGGPEVPVLDGSSAPFVRLITEAGTVTQTHRQPYLKIMQPIEIADGARRVRIEPSATPRISYSIQYDHPLIQKQSFQFEWSALSFERDIAEARTFGFLHEIEALWARGLGRGGSLENTVVLSKNSILNKSGLRFTDEFVRHKILDLMGDLALLGVPFIGHLMADRSGHALHTRLVDKILAQPDKWVLLNLDDVTASRRARHALTSSKPIYATAMAYSPAQ